MAFFSPTLLFSSVTIAVLYLLYRFTVAKSHANPLPPGPKGLPIVGNINDLPKPGEVEYQHWLKHRDIYGPMSSVTVMGQTFVIVNDANMALELLRDRANTNSGRPQQTLSMDMIGWKDSLGFLQPSETFKIHRRNFSKVTNSAAVQATFNRVQEEESVHFLKNMLDTPSDLFDHIRKETGAVILRITYGYTPNNIGRDPLVDLAERALSDFTDSSVPGKYFVDIVPALRYLPEWFPGTEFKQIAKRMRKTLTETKEIPYRFVKEQMRKGTYKTSFLSKAIQDTNLTPQMEHIHKWSALSIFAGGADTTVSSIMSFFLAMILFPEVQRKAQEEVDYVTGGTRLPVTADKENLPYIEALCNEVLRWIPVGPMALPHTSETTQVYNGYRIPRGAVIMPNSWWFLHDPAVYASPESFRPERFLSTPTHTSEPDPRVYSFGYGRRACPGRAVAENALFVTIAQVLAVFDITKPVVNGKVVEPKFEIEPGVISHPKPFQACVRPRSEKHVELIANAVEMYPCGESDARFLEGIDLGKQ